MTPEPNVDLVSHLYVDGVESVERVTSSYDRSVWELPACGHWTGTQTARHVLAVSRWYHEWLDSAIAGDASPPFLASEIDHRNDRALIDIGEMSGPDAVKEFQETATSYLDRAVDHWDLAYGYPFGTVTVGLHLGVAATEWHLHAWDLSHGSEHRHRPQQADALFAAAGMCLAETQGGLAGTALRLLIPIGARRKPWSTILERSGRSPTTDPVRNT